MRTIRDKSTRRFRTLAGFTSLAFFLTVPVLNAQSTGPKSGPCTVNGQHKDDCSPGEHKQADREAARSIASPQSTGSIVKFAGVKTSKVKSPLAETHEIENELEANAASNVATSKVRAAAALPIGPSVMMPNATPDYYGVGNYANSPLPVLNATGGIVAGSGMRKFVDTLPGLCALGTNDLGQCIPLATPDTTTYPGSDFYRIGLQEYNLQMHKDLPANTLGTRLRGYVQLSATNAPPAGKQQYLGPLILATRNRPVRILFKNLLTTDLPLPVDTTYLGAAPISTNGFVNQKPSLRRATLHLHGGNTPWISDGTTHQWTTPAGGDGQQPVKGLAKGWSASDVPDMVPPGCGAAGNPKCVNPAPSATDGSETFFWTNEQSGRLMFYHDHAYGITRLNVYSGEAAGYLLVDGKQESALKAATVPGTILTKNESATSLSQVPDLANSDIAHVLPLVIQDKTFVPDNATPGYQLAAQDPTWDVTKWGGLGNLWWPHVYTPNQNPADLTGANGFGRWDWGPWFHPPQTPTSLVLQGYTCNSVAVPTGGKWAFPPLMCPGVPDPTRSATTTPPSNSPSGTPESFMDTPVVNGTAYPTLTVDPTAYRFQILSVGNDRALNLGLYVADPLTVSVTSSGAGYLNPPAVPPAVTITGCTAATGTAVVNNGAVADIRISYPATGPACTGIPTVAIAAPPASVGAAPAYAIASVNTDVKMVSAANATSRTSLPNCSGAQPTMWGGGQVTGLLDATGNPLNGTGLPANCWPLYTSNAGFTAGTLGEGGVLSWGNSDSRMGGVPDPTTAGPPFIQIGTEGGLLPAPVVIPSTPISYDYNKRSITVLNVLNHGLMLGAAERADVIVDFSKFAGKTLIVYNDAPAPFPGADPRLDYYTNDPDQSSTGGAPTTVAGYGPNVRTIMQIVVKPACTGACPPAFNLASLSAALPGIFASTQDTVIIPQPAYPATNGGGANPSYSRIQDNSLTVQSATAYDPKGVCPAAPCAVPMLPKAIQELFTLDYGRMNATLGVELPFTNFTTQTTIPYGYNDPTTEIIKDGETQLWKITHNGVDTHFIHFHLFTVQVINRVGWDGAVKPPDPNELAFKDTVRMNPLESIIVALRPFKQNPLPFDVPNSVRPLNVTSATNTMSTTEYTNVDPTNQPANVVNDLVNFGWEYVWHCHILGHEENDMMRSVIFAVSPSTPTGLKATPVGSNRVNLAWAELASPPYTGFTVQRATNAAFTTGLASFTVPAAPLTFSDTTVTPGNYFYRILASNLVGYTRTYAAPAAGYPHVAADSVPSAGVPVHVSGAILQVTPAGPLAFSSPLNVASATQVLTVKNIGDLPMTITGAGVISGTNAAMFHRTTTCGATLAANATCTITVHFQPTSIAPVTKTAALAVNVAAPAISDTIAMTGTVLIPALNLAPGALAFGNVTHGTTSAAQTVTVTNTGTGPLTLNGIAIGGANAGQFAISAATTCKTGAANALAPNGTCTIAVTFKPVSPAGARSAALNVTVAAPAANGSVTLTGSSL